MDDFFKDIKGNLEGRQEPPFEENAWKRMEAKLEEQPKRRRALFFWWWLVLPLLGLSLLSNLLVFKELQSLKSRHETLEIRRDTVYKTKTVFVTDTIYETRVLYKTVREYLPTSIAQGNRTDGMGDISPSSSVPINLVPVENEGTTGKEPISNQPSYQETQAAQFDFSDPISFQLPGLKLKPFDIATKKLQVRNNPKQPIEPKPGFGKELLSQCKNLSIGLKTGWAFPLADGLDWKSGVSGGWHIAVPMSKNTRFYSELSIFNLRYESDRMGDDIGIPVVLPPLPEYQLVKAEVPQLSLQLTSGFQQFMETERKLRPYFGLGLGFEDGLNYQITYDFRNPDTGIEWIFEKQAETKRKTNYFLVSKLGFERSIGNSWFWDLHASYRMNLRTSGYQSPNLVNFSTGINYQFGQKNRRKRSVSPRKERTDF